MVCSYGLRLTGTFTYVIHIRVMAGVGYGRGARILPCVDIQKRREATRAHSCSGVSDTTNALHADAREVGTWGTREEVQRLSFTDKARGSHRTVIIYTIDVRWLRHAPPEPLDVIIEEARDADVADGGVPFTVRQCLLPAARVVRDEVFMQVCRAAVRVPRVRISRLHNDVGVLVQKDFTLKRQKCVRLHGVRAQLSDCSRQQFQT